MSETLYHSNQFNDLNPIIGSKIGRLPKTFSTQLSRNRNRETWSFCSIVANAHRAKTVSIASRWSKISSFAFQRYTQWVISLRSRYRPKLVVSGSSQ
jgi:hypothetical protein